jgi:hypothetical protein
VPACPVPAIVVAPSLLTPAVDRSAQTASGLLVRTAAGGRRWSDWHVASNGYPEFNYLLNDNGTFNFYGGPTGGRGVTGTPDNYGVDVLNADARSFITRNKQRPFVLEVRDVRTTHAVHPGAP